MLCASSIPAHYLAPEFFYQSSTPFPPFHSLQSAPREGKGGGEGLGGGRWLACPHYPLEPPVIL